MAITIVTEKMTRWKGTSGDLKTLVIDAVELVTERTGTAPRVAVAATLQKVETQFAGFEDFESAIRDDFHALEKVIVTIGEFDRNSELSAEVTMSSDTDAAAVVLKVRGHDEAVVNWLAEKLMRALGKGSRRFALTLPQIYLIAISLYVVGQYFFYEYVDLPELNSSQQYLAILVASVLPIAVGVSAMRLMGWLVPQLELLPKGAMPRWNRYRRRTRCYCRRSYLRSAADCTSGSVRILKIGVR